MNKIVLENFKTIYLKPKIVYFLPLIGFFKYTKDVNKFGDQIRLFDKSTPGGKQLSDYSKGLAVNFNFFFLLVLIFSALIFNLAFFVYRKTALAAADRNADLDESLRQ